MVYLVVVAMAGCERCVRHQACARYKVYVQEGAELSHSQEGFRVMHSKCAGQMDIPSVQVYLVCPLKIRWGMCHIVTGLVTAWDSCRCHRGHC